MASVSSTSRVESIDLQAMVSAAALAQHNQSPQAAPTPTDNAEPSAQISSVGRLRSATAAVLDVSARLNATQTWSASAATSCRPEIAQAQYGQATSGDYAVSVDSLATAQTTSSATFSSLSTVIGIGTLNIELGGWNTSQSTFATNPNWPKASVTFGPKDTSLERIRDKINAAGVGVIATVISDATGSRLVLRSTATGEDNGFKATVEPSATHSADPSTAQALASLGYDPSSAGTTSGQLIQPAQNAQATINGRKVSSSQNLIEDEATGLSLRLNQTSNGEDVQIKVQPDTASMAQNIHDFANAYNDLTEQLKAVPADATDAGVSTARAIQEQVQSAFSSDGASSGLAQQLASVGVQMNTHGELHVDDDKLQQALSQDSGHVQTLFAAPTDSTQSGLTARLDMLHMDDHTYAPAATSAGLPSTDTKEAPTAPGTYVRQKLLEQYAAQNTASSDEDRSIAANAA